MYNFLHTCKLPLTGLFRQTFLPVHIREKERQEIVGFVRGLECLMCIHHQYFEPSVSHILNIFNLHNSRIKGDYKNTLMIPRLLCFVRNQGNEVFYNDIVTFFREWGYDMGSVHIAVDRCLDYGLLSSLFGRSHTHLERSPEAKVITTRSIHLYMDDFRRTDYLSLVAEDTPMEEEYIVPIWLKYPGLPSPPSRAFQKRIDPIREAQKQFLAFLTEEEKRERRSIEDIGYAWDSYLFSASIRSGHTGRTLADWIGQDIKDTS